MAENIGYGRQKLIHQIVKENFKVDDPTKKSYQYNEILFIIQELFDEEGKKYFERKTSEMGFNVFREFVKYLLYRNIANYDSMVLLSSEKGCITDDSLIEMPRDLTKYPKGIPVKELIGKKNFLVYSYNVKTNKIELKKAQSCEFAKYDDVYELELIDGRKLCATSDHPVLLTDGTYCQIKDLIWNKKENKYNFQRNEKYIRTSRIRMFNRKKVTKHNNYINYNYNQNNNSKAILEHRFIAKSLGNINGKIVHHIDGNHLNNSVDNLEIISQQEHIKRHSILIDGRLIHPGWGNGNNKGKKFNMNREKYKIGTKERSAHLSLVSHFRFNTYSSNRTICRTKSGGIIKSITYIGKKNVYDIVGVEDNRNFIANGFVVSNTGKSSAAIMLAREWCRLLGIKFDPGRHIAYNNADVMNRIDILNKFEPLVCDESIRFASSEDWNLKINKTLKKKLGQVRTKHLFYIMCFPLKIYKLEKTYLESYVNYWIDLFGRGKGAIYVKDRNPVHDSWRLKDFMKIDSYSEFTVLSKVEKALQKHPNFWRIIKFPKPPDWLYNKYLRVRERNVYDDDNVMKNVSKEDIHNALLILALRDIMSNDVNLTMNRIILHLKNNYDFNLPKSAVQIAIEDARQLVAKVREQVIKHD